MCAEGSTVQLFIDVEGMLMVDLPDYYKEWQERYVKTGVITILKTKKLAGMRKRLNNLFFRSGHDSRHRNVFLFRRKPYRIVGIHYKGRLLVGGHIGAVVVCFIS